MWGVAEGRLGAVRAELVARELEAVAAGQPLDAAVRMGNACGALAATRPGAQPAMPSRAEVERLLTPNR